MKWTLFLISMVMITTVFAQAGGGGGPAEPDPFVECLISNCDSFCKQQNFDAGKYHQSNQCKCENHEESEFGKIVKSEETIEVIECNPTDEEYEYAWYEDWFVWLVVLVNAVLIIAIIITIRNMTKDGRSEEWEEE